MCGVGELYGLIDDELLLEIANKYNIPLPSDFEDVHEITNENPPAKQKSARAARGYVYSPSECLAMGLVVGIWLIYFWSCLRG